MFDKSRPITMKMIIPLNADGIPEIINRCRALALQSKCKRPDSRCGSVLISSRGLVIGEGYNSQPCDIDGPCFKDTLPANFKSDKTCCIHSEARAIYEAMRLSSADRFGSTLYFVRVDDAGNLLDCGDPYCTMCSKLALDAGVSRFVLYHSEGLRSYDTKYYNELSFQYKS